MSYEFAESSESLPKMGEKMFSNMIQIRLAQVSYEARHGEKPDMSNSVTRNAVGMEWAALYASSFGRYISSHPQETFDISDEDALFRLFEKLTPGEELN
jgi:hypothetical protein